MSDPNTLDVSATGTGALVEAASHFPRSNAAYALLRSNHVIDRSVTTKFAYVDWTCENTPPTRKAVLSTHKPQARHLLQPFHVDLVATDNSDIQDGQSVIDRKIAAASGTAINERSMAEATQAGAYFKAGAGAGIVLPTINYHILFAFKFLHAQVLSRRVVPALPMPRCLPRSPRERTVIRWF
jgi:hypothetical protein